MPKIEKNIERRVFAVDQLTIEPRAEGKRAKIAGHAAVFNQEADLGWFRERIEPGAFSESIGKDDVRALFNHDPNFVLGRNKSKTLRMSEDAVGLAIENDPPDTQWARDLLVSIERGDISQMSFGFRVINQRWETKDGVEVRIISKVQLFDVSPVTFPAYAQTDVALRSFENHKKELDSALSASSAVRDAALAQAQSRARALELAAKDF